MTGTREGVDHPESGEEVERLRSLGKWFCSAALSLFTRAQAIEQKAGISTHLLILEERGERQIPLW